MSVLWDIYKDCGLPVRLAGHLESPRQPYGTFTIQNVKPIFHCNAKSLALGPCVGLDPQRDDFALGIATCWYLKTLADPRKD